MAEAPPDCGLAGLTHAEQTRNDSGYRRRSRFKQKPEDCTQLLRQTVAHPAACVLAILAADCIVRRRPGISGMV